ncbi:MAG: hypothetical protein RBR86_09810 [Pseudobdellovibrionaceae bacterium]|jgi:exonuclease I|nr:hypothetical protein [Pseudobdellovibrionaceae bacterium]
MEKIPNRLIARKKDIWHKVEMGILFDAYYDTETTDLSKRFSEITQFGGVITDLAGNVLYREDLRAKVSPYAVISPFAWLVQRLRLEDIKKGDPKPVFMGKVKRFFEYSNQLHHAPFSGEFLKICRRGVYKGDDGKSEGYYAYPVANEDGTVDWEAIRVHENLRKFYFKVGNKKWVKRDIKSMCIGYNNVNADDQWLWTQAFMSGHENVFMTHLIQNGCYRLDALRVVEALYCLGGRGENGLKVPHKTRRDMQAEIPSFSMGGVLGENTRFSDDLRQITEGIVLEDGSHVDLEQLHGALSDAFALRALMVFIRRHHSDHLSQMERNSDWKFVIDSLTEGEPRFGASPPLAYIDKTYPGIDGKMVTLIGTDQYRNAPKVAVVWNLNIDPMIYRYNGKEIQDLAIEDWVKIVESGKSNPNAPLKVIRAHKSPRLFPAESGYRAGFHQGVDRLALFQRIRVLDRSKVKNKIMHAVREAYPRIFGADRLVMAQPEEELFDFSTLVMFDRVAGEDVQVHNRVQNQLEKIARDSRIRIMQIKSLWLRSIQIDEDVLLDRGTNPEAFGEKISHINRELKKKGGVQIPASDTPILTYEDALRYKIKILYFAREYLITGQLQDIGHHFWFEDQEGVRYSYAELKSCSSDALDYFLRSRKISIRHESKSALRLVIDRIIESLGYADILNSDTRRQLDAFKMLRNIGIPHYHGRSQRWYTVEDARKDVAKLERNEINDDELEAIEHIFPGMWTIWMQHHHDTGTALSEYKSYLESLPYQEVEKDLLPYVGLNPETLYPLRRADFSINLNTAHVIDVPDRYIENPVQDPLLARKIWIIPVADEFKKSSIRIRNVPLENIILKSSETGKLFHLANAKFIDAPPQGGAYEDFYKKIAQRYSESGQEFLFIDKGEGFISLVGNGPYPVHGIRPVKDTAQTLHLQNHIFESLISPKLSGNISPAKACLIRDDNLKLGKGIARLQEYFGNAASGWELEAEIVRVNSISLQELQSMSEYELSDFGFKTQDQAIDSFCALFANQKKAAKDPRNKVLAVYFGGISQHDPDRGMMFFKPDTRIFSMNNS